VDSTYISVDDAAADIGVSRATVWKWIKRYDLPTFRFLGDRKTFVQKADIERLKQPIEIDPTKKCAA